MHGLDSGDTPQDHLLFKLWCAVQDNDLKTVEECLKNGVGHDAENGKSLDLIQTACDMENKELLKLLIKYNINLQKKYIDDTPYGMIHPLKIAAVKYNAEMLNMLFEAGYKLESATPSMNYNINRFIMYTLRNMFSNFRIATLQISPGQLPITQLEEKLVDTLKVIVKNTPERSVARRYIVNCCFSNYMLNWNPGQKSGVKVTEYLLSIDPNYRVPEHYISRARGKIRELLEAHNRKLPDASNRKTSTPRRRSGKR